ncbi:unnamed protein product [Rotaria socialis]|uniref:Bis(5'-adenosyl)-triphosphatase n=1 Tax=Rotaria socialis TaxID=392032 RepID=A0A818MFC5_9BILA|nr:unnamed protein product [Rotaria socialis]CAF3418732.1 unnamed protein product [Rotaria socialis]CAF3465858.1 unnamed protein product [Rotaria socialis]CAF3589749.1 unnamed protein product [Rotaria socialis]CAF4256008.1 unnamed protein product [Rotaria socialis]
MSSKIVRIGVCQLNCRDDKNINFKIGEELIKQAKKEEAKIVFFPEGFDFICESKSLTLEKAETIDGPIINGYRRLAKENQLWISLGGFHQRTEVEDRILNSHLIINDRGEIVSHYSKIHLFDVQAGSLRIQESDYTQAGSSIIKPIETPGGRIGLGICYDLRFPEFARLLTVSPEDGAQILTYPSAFTKHTGEAHWEILLRSRAIENQCFVVAAAQVGFHNTKRESYGHSLVVDPWGKILLDMNLDSPSIRTIDLDLSYIEQVREKMPIIQHRRKDLYTLISSTNIAVPIKNINNEKIRWGQLEITASQIFFRSTLSIGLVNKKPIVPGHVLVSPIRCVERFSQLYPEEINDLFLSTQLVSTKIEEFYQGKSLSIAIQDGEYAGQTVKHVHVHILPRKPSDFEENDTIYHELAHHDKKAKGWRSDDEMAQEAKLLRKLFYRDIE